MSSYCLTASPETKKIVQKNTQVNARRMFFFVLLFYQIQFYFNNFCHFDNNSINILSSSLLGF